MPWGSVKAWGYKAWALVKGLGIGQGGRIEPAMSASEAGGRETFDALSKLARCTGNDPSHHRDRVGSLDLCITAHESGVSLVRLERTLYGFGPLPLPIWGTYVCR